ncbi:hypothetical protein [Streptomyces griseoluteus]|uniref:hypothetical protein n=1 Tax=Streptomyces griseoluteus TaxID=29306 RepID=UPI00366625D7
MTPDLRPLSHRLRGTLETAVAILDLPLDHRHIEALALELTGPVRAMLAETLAAVTADPPVPYALTSAEDTTDEVEVAEYAGCVSRTGLDVDLDSPAARLAQHLSTTQHDVVSTDVPNGQTLGITVRPQSLDCWRWWLGRLGVDPQQVTMIGDTVTGTGHHKGVSIALRGDGVRELLADRGAARLMGVLAPTAS